MVTHNEPVTTRVDAPVITITLNRPQKRNALSRAMIEDLRQALRDAHLEKRARAVVLTGAGDAFCAGRDVGEMRGHEEGAQSQMQRWGEEAEQTRDLVLEMLRLPKPIIAAVNGPALGLGAGLVLAADVVIAGETATFGLPNPRLGLVAGVEAPLLAYRLGAGPAARLLMTGDAVDAAEALRLGVFHEGVATDLLWARSVEVGKQCAACSPESLGLTKRVLLETIGEQLETQLANGAIAAATARTTESAEQGLSAFLEKREPEWW